MTNAMSIEMPVKEGFVSFRGYSVWYRIVGDREAPGRFPLLCLHGGPGYPHDYFEPLELIAAAGRRIILYDQLGCGNSDVPADPALYTIALYLEEIDTIRQALQLQRCHILGHSWGGMLAMEYALTQPAGLTSLVLADTTASIPQWVAEITHLIADLPPEVQHTLSRHETSGTTDSAEYQEAVRTFFRRHGSGRIQPRPDCLKRLDNKPGGEVYHIMWGTSEWSVTGTLKDWDITARLREIRVPTLVVGARFDYATPALSETMHHAIHDSELVIFEHSGHFAHLEETELYLKVLDQFLNRVEARA